MARGWESKSVESQIEEADERRARAAVQALSEAELVRVRERDIILLSRTRVLDDLQTATNARYQEQLRRTLQFLDDKLAALEPGASTPDRHA
jgi:hypothetical protein